MGVGWGREEEKGVERGRETDVKLTAYYRAYRNCENLIAWRLVSDL